MVNNYLAGVDADVDGGTVGLLPLDPLDVDPELGPVALNNLTHLKDKYLNRRSQKKSSLNGNMFLY